MAERRRRGDKAAEERRAGATESGNRAKDEVVDEAALSEESVIDADSEDELDMESDEESDELEDVDEEDLGDADETGDEESSRGRRRGAGKADKAASTGPAGRKSDKNKPAKTKTSDRPNIFGRFANFVREVVAELRKVIWPTRSELLTYTTVVVVFVVIMFTLVGALDYGFAKGVLWVFGYDAPEGE